MRLITSVAAIAIALLTGSTTVAGSASNADAGNLAGVGWTVTSRNDNSGSATIAFRYETSSTSFSLDRAKPDLAQVRAALASPAGPAAFSLDREAGLLACRGMMRGSYEGSGTCSFTPDREFLADLRARGLGPEGWPDMLAMTLLNATRALIDGLARQGVAPKKLDDVIASAALEVTPGYVAALQAAGLDLRSLDDAIACRALEVDADYVRAMAKAGYPGSAQQVIAMKATGVTPEYARRLTAAAQN